MFHKLWTDVVNSSLLFLGKWQHITALQHYIYFYSTRYNETPTEKNKIYRNYKHYSEIHFKFYECCRMLKDFAYATYGNNSMYERHFFNICNSIYNL